MSKQKAWAGQAVTLGFLSIAVFSSGMAIHAGWQRNVQNIGRAHIPDYLNPILFGDLAMLGAVLCAAGLVWVMRSGGRSPFKTARVTIMVMGIFGGLLASVYSGSRGAWVVLPPAIFVLFALQWRHLTRWAQGGIAGLVLAVVLVSYSLPQTGVATRIEPVKQALVGLAEGEPTRVFWYRPTLYIVIARDLLPGNLWRGYGRGALPGALHTLSEQASSPYLQRIAASSNAWHAHNDILQALFTRGLPGLGLLLLAYLAPLIWALRRLHQRRPAWDSAERAVLTALVLLPICYAGFGLTYSLFAYAIPTAVYGLLLTTLSILAHLSSLLPSDEID